MIGTRPAQKAGFTLLEIMFAAGIVGMALAFLFGSLVTVSVASNMTQNRAIVATHIARVFEELHGAGLDRTLTYVPAVSRDLGVNAAEAIRVEALIGGSFVALPVDPATVSNPPNPLLVRCTATWIGIGNRPLSYDASQFFYR